MGIFPQPGDKKWGCGLRYLPKMGSGGGDRVKIAPVPVPILARGLISIPVPSPPPTFPNAGGAPMGAEIPVPFPSLVSSHTKSN